MTRYLVRIRYNFARLQDRNCPLRPEDYRETTVEQWARDYYEARKLVQQQKQFPCAEVLQVNKVGV
jgi:hypothetical protein